MHLPRAAVGTLPWAVLVILPAILRALGLLSVH